MSSRCSSLDTCAHLPVYHISYQCLLVAWQQPRPCCLNVYALEKCQTCLIRTCLRLLLTSTVAPREHEEHKGHGCPLSHATPCPLAAAVQAGVGRSTHHLEAPCAVDVHTLILMSSKLQGVCRTAESETPDPESPEDVDEGCRHGVSTPVMHSLCM